MKLLDQLNIQTKRAAGVIQEAADAHQIAAKKMSETADAATVALYAVAAVAILALAIAVYAVISK